MLARLGGSVKLKIWTYKSRPFDPSGGGAVVGAVDNGVGGGRGFSGEVTMVRMFPRGCGRGAQRPTLSGECCLFPPHMVGLKGVYCCFLGVLGRHRPHSCTQ